MHWFRKVMKILTPTIPNISVAAFRRDCFVHMLFLQPTEHNLQSKGLRRGVLKGQCSAATKHGSRFIWNQSCLVLALRPRGGPCWNTQTFPWKRRVLKGLTKLYSRSLHWFSPLSLETKVCDSLIETSTHQQQWNQMIASKLSGNNLLLRLLMFSHKLWRFAC